MLGFVTSKYHISDNLRFVRRITGLSQEEAAQLMGLARSSYNALEAGARDATLHDLNSLEQLSGISADLWLHSSMRNSFQDEFKSNASLLSVDEFIHEYFRLSYNGRKIIARHISDYYQREVET